MEYITMLYVICILFNNHFDKKEHEEQERHYRTAIAAKNKIQKYGNPTPLCYI